MSPSLYHQLPSEDPESLTEQLSSEEVYADQPSFTYALLTRSCLRITSRKMPFDRSLFPLIRAGFIFAFLVTGLSLWAGFNLCDNYYARWFAIGFLVAAQDALLKAWIHSLKPDAVDRELWDLLETAGWVINTFLMGLSLDRGLNTACKSPPPSK